MRHLNLAASVIAGAVFTASASSAQMTDLPGLDQTVAYIQERCDGVTETGSGIGDIRYEWMFDRGAATIISKQYSGGGTSIVTIPINYVTFSNAYEDPTVAVRCPDVYLNDQCPNTSRGNMRYVNLFCRERDKAVNALRHLQTLMGGPAPANDPFA